MRFRIGLGTMIIGLALAGCERVNVEAGSSNLACDIDYSANKAMEMIDIESGLAIYNRFVLDDLSENDLSEEEMQSLDRMQVILDSRKRPVNRQDLMILDSADERLSDALVWDHTDDRKCEPQDETCSRYCSV